MKYCPQLYHHSNIQVAMVFFDPPKKYLKVVALLTHKKPEVSIGDVGRYRTPFLAISQFITSLHYLLNDEQ